MTVQDRSDITSHQRTKPKYAKQWSTTPPYSVAFISLQRYPTLCNAVCDAQLPLSSITPKKERRTRNKKKDQSEPRYPEREGARASYLGT